MIISKTLMKRLIRQKFIDSIFMIGHFDILINNSEQYTLFYKHRNAALKDADA